MGFDHANDSTPAAAPAVGNSELSVKISHGNEIRRVTLPQTSYSSLLEHTASLFGLPQANINLKYEDDDGDKISMSSEMELNEALRLSKASQKILRLFVELKALPSSASEAPPTVKSPEPPVSRGVYLGPQGGRFGPPHMHPPGPGFHPHPHPPPHHPHHHTAPPGFSPADFHHPPPPHFPPHFAPFQSSTTPSAPPQLPAENLSASAGPTYAAHGTSTYAAPLGGSSGPMDSERDGRGWGGRGGWGRGGWGRGGVHYGPDHRHRGHFGHHSYFGPQSYSSQSSGTWDNNQGFDRKAHKESMRAMKEQWKEMKEEMKRSGNATEEDKRRFKEMKEQMKNEMRFAKKDAVLGMKAMKISDKKQRLVARHVEDVTIPDGTELPPNTPFIKTWKIRNEGPAWPTGSQLLFVSHKGDNLNGPERVVIKGEVLPGQEVEVSVPLITPGEPGRYVGYYRMVTPEGVKFGQRVWVAFVVKGPNDITTN